MQEALVRGVEAPSGKNAAYENFPVGSWLLPARLRPHVATFYAFARSADDIADSNLLEAADKIERLNGYERALLGGEVENPAYAKAHAMRASLAETRTSSRHCVDLLAAFKQDATKLRYRDWADLIAYCRLSAAPVGRYLVDVHGGSADGYISSDALCIALQILNHLQDAKADYLDLDRVYLPTIWFAAERSTVAELRGDSSTPGLRRVFNRALDGVDKLLEVAQALGPSLCNRRLAMEAEAILMIARRLSAKLRVRDPLGPRVKLTKGQYLGCCVSGILSAIARR